MAIILLDKSVCRICGQVMRAGDDIVSFPPFTAETTHPYYFFTDAGFHRACFDQHPLADELIGYLQGVLKEWPLGGPFCHVCGKQITDPDEHFGLYHLTDSPDDPLYPYNDIHMHRACLRHFDGLSVVLNAQGLSDALMRNLDELRRIVSAEPGEHDQP